MPARFLLDTNICIYIAKRRPPEVLSHFEQHQVGEVAMSIITYGELRFGAEKSRHAEAAHNNLERLAELVPPLPLPSKAAVCYGRIRALLEKAGTPIGANDLWIAAHAMAEDLTLVSNNTGEFNRIPNLLLENWASQCR